ncbi:MAG: hypothetical protein IJ764_00485 [Bacteroidales bacterium]|nr:hypothetical protein [Bacteroidales bacterium]
MKKQEESLQITLGGGSHQVDANTLINELVHFTTVINAANDEYGQNNRKINIKVNALKEGSFIIDLSVAENLAASLFSRSSIEYAAAIVTLVGVAFKVYRRCKGRKATEKEVGNIHIGDNITIQQVINIYNTKVVREAISKAIETAESDINVESINIASNLIEPIKIEREEFNDLIYEDFASEDTPPQTIEEDVDATLAIIALRFEAGGKWLFNWNGIRIPLTVKDDALMRQIDHGERFGKGDAIKVKMRITKTWSAEYNCYENKNYKIVEFYEHIVSPKQQVLPVPEK